MFNPSTLLSRLELPNSMIEVINLRKNKVLVFFIFTEVDYKVSKQAPLNMTKYIFFCT